MKKNSGYKYILITTFLWGIAPPIIKAGLDTTPSSVFLFYRFLIASLLVLPWIIKYFKELIKKSTNKWVTWAAFLGTPLNLILLYLGLEKLSSIESGIAMATMPLMANFLGALILKEEITNNEKIGGVLAFFGMIMVPVLELLAGQGSFNSFNSLIGIILITLGNLVYVLSNIIVKKYHPKQDPFQFSLISFVQSLIFFGLITLIFYPHYITDQTIITQTLWSTAGLGILYMATFGSIIAFTTYQKSLHYLEASEAAEFNYLQPLFTIPASYIILGERITGPLIISTTIIVIGIIISLIRPKKNRK